MAVISCGYNSAPFFLGFNWYSTGKMDESKLKQLANGRPKKLSKRIWMNILQIS